MKTFVDTSVWVSAFLETEAESARSKEAIEKAVEPTTDTTILLETFLVLRSKRGLEFAANAVARMLSDYAYLWVSRTTFQRAALRSISGLRIGDALIVENALTNRARLLTLDRGQAGALGESAVLLNS